MALTWATNTENVDWAELADLMRIAPLADRTPDEMQRAYRNSMFACFAFDGPRLVAAGRVMADGVSVAYLCDVVIHPDHQGQGLGSEVVERLVALSKGHKKVILYAVPGKEPFYEKFGFRRMKTAMAIFEDPEEASHNGYIL